MLDTTYTSLSRAVFRSSLNSECEEISCIQQCSFLEELHHVSVHNNDHYDVDRMFVGLS